MTDAKETDDRKRAAALADELSETDIERRFAMSNFLKRLPIVRHVRAIIAAYRVDRHYRICSSLGMIPVNRDYDDGIIREIWSGKR